MTRRGSVSFEVNCSNCGTDTAFTYSNEEWESLFSVEVDVFNDRCEGNPVVQVTCPNCDVNGEVSFY